MKINKVAIIGAGAIGAYFIWGLSDKLEENLFVTADGKRNERLKKDGIIINDKHFKLNVKSPSEMSDIDLILVCTKYGALNDVLDDIEMMVSENTIVASLLNGIDSEKIIGDRIGHEHMIYSLMRISSERTGNSIIFNPEKTLGFYYGEKDCLERTERLYAIEALLADTVLSYHFVPDIVTDQWIKYASNMSFNLPQAILNVGYGAYEDSEHVEFISKKIWEEVTAVAAAKGIIVTPYPGINKNHRKNARFSTLQDLDAKRHTEVDMFAGVLARMGQELSVPVPYCEFAYHAIKALEEKNDGKI